MAGIAHHEGKTKYKLHALGEVRQRQCFQKFCEINGIKVRSRNAASEMYSKLFH